MTDMPNPTLSADALRDLQALYAQWISVPHDQLERVSDTFIPAMLDALPALLTAAGEVTLLRDAIDRLSTAIEEDNRKLLKARIEVERMRAEADISCNTNWTLLMELDRIRAEVARIADDYHSSRPQEDAQALAEMREALMAIEMPKAVPPDGYYVIRNGVSSPISTLPRPASGPAEAAAWRPLDDDARTNGRCLVAWRAAGGFPPHVELGRFRLPEGWCNTYGKKFNCDEPDLYMPLPSVDEAPPAAGSTEG